MEWLRVQVLAEHKNQFLVFIRLARDQAMALYSEAAIMYSISRALLKQGKKRLKLWNKKQMKSFH